MNFNKSIGMQKETINAFINGTDLALTQIVVYASKMHMAVQLMQILFYST